MMSGCARLTSLPFFLVLIAGLIGISGCHSRTSQKNTPPAQLTKAPATPLGPVTPAPRPRPASSEFPVMLGIDVLESTGFRAVAGKRIGLLTHAAGVNRRGESTVDVLRRASNTRLVCLFAPEHSLNGDVKAGDNFDDYIDPRTRLPVYSLHGKNRKPTPAELKTIDALVIDLQDIGVRSYTFNVVMRYAMEACFANNVEVIILDRPNPLGGLKVDGPSLDAEWMSGVGAFRIPYVHGLTMAELGLMAASAPGVLDIPDNVRRKGRLTIVPMRGWKRSMRWPETGLKFVPTSPLVRDFNAVVGYAMVGLGCEFSGFKHGIGPNYPFRGLTFKNVTADKLIQDLTALRLPGLTFRKIIVPEPGGSPKEGVYVEVSDWTTWNPTELSFQLMRLACRYDPPNPFARLDPKDARSFNIHVGSTAWWEALKRDGAHVNLDAFSADWRARAKIYQQQTRRYWLYN
jgi:uncharacterized protein YbbC (DUF1343 family)